MTALPLRARQPDRDRRPQSPAAGREHRRHQGARAAGRQVGRVRLRGPRNRRPRLHRAARGDAALHHRQARRRDRQHDQGQGRLVHGEPRRVAPQGAHRRAGRTRHPGAHPMTFQLAADAQTYDCRKAFADTLLELARADERIVAVCNDSVGSSNLVAFRDEFPGPPDQRRHRRGRTSSGVGAGLANGGLIPFVSAAGPVPHRPPHWSRSRPTSPTPRPCDPLRTEPGRRLRRARPDAPLDRGPSPGRGRSTTSNVLVPADPVQTRACRPLGSRESRPALPARAALEGSRAHARGRAARARPGRARLRRRRRHADRRRHDGLARRRRRRAAASRRHLGPK